LNAAKITFTATDTSGSLVANSSLTLPPGTHGAANLGPLFGVASFRGSITITALQPIVSLALNSEAPPVFSSLPAGDAGLFEVYGAWHCSNDACTWSFCDEILPCRGVRTVERTASFVLRLIRSGQWR
jgi:hypothetical protein